MYRGAAPSDAGIGPRPDANHGGHLHQQVHRRRSRTTDPAFNRAAGPRCGRRSGRCGSPRALLEREVVRQDPRRLAKVAATVERGAERLAWMMEKLRRSAPHERAGRHAHEQRVELPRWPKKWPGSSTRSPRHAQVAIGVAPDLPTWPPTQPRLELVLLNLVANAIRVRDPKKAESFVEIAEARRAVPR